MFQTGTAEVVDDQRQQLVYQEGYIDISELDGSLRMIIDGHELEVALPALGECFSLVVQSRMVKSNMVFYRDEVPSETLVFINGRQVQQSKYYNPELSASSPRSPMRISADQAG